MDVLLIQLIMLKLLQFSRLFSKKEISTSITTAQSTIVADTDATETALTTAITAAQSTIIAE